MGRRFKRNLGILLLFLQLVIIIQTIKDGGNLIGDSCYYSNGGQGDVACVSETFGFYLIGFIGFVLIIKSKKN